jgi:hypothetical protein
MVFETMIKSILIILILLSYSLIANANENSKKVLVLEDIYKSPYLLVDNENFYITDRYLRKVFIYSNEKLEKISEFGRKGEGPGEFMVINCTSLTDDYICISSFPKLCFFNKKGKLIKEIKGPPDTGTFKPFGKNFIGQSYPYSKPSDKIYRILYSLFDPGLSKKKDIYLAEFNKFVIYSRPKMISMWVRDCTKAVPYKDKLIVGSTYKGFYFSVFDVNGNMLNEITIDYEKRKITDEEKQRKINEDKKDSSEQRWNDLIARVEIRFPEYYPAYANFIVDNHKIYVFLYPRETTEIRVLDFKGILLKKRNIPYFKYGFITGDQHTIYEGKFYYLIDNKEEETWEIHTINIDGVPGI